MSKNRRRSSEETQRQQDSASLARLILVIPANESVEQQKLRRDLSIRAERAGLSILKAIRLVQHRVTGGEEKDRLFPLVDFTDAAWIYAQIHRYDVAVITFGAAYVRRDPSQLPARRKHLLSLERFVRYKAYFGMVRSKQDTGRHLHQFEASNYSVDCNGHDDPRILPLHIFYCTKEWATLHDLREQDRFAQEHGPSSQRRDCANLYWERPKGQAARHGGLALRVARYALQQGFHWDVSPQSQGKLYTPDAVWKLHGRSSYLNVYPDGYIRATKRGARAVKVWPRS